jgi:group I intron endonuclease
MSNFYKPVSTIYRAVNKINAHSYIGFDSRWPNRMRQHKEKYKKENRKFYDAIKKYGWDNFEWEILYQSLDAEHCLTIMESQFIQEYNSMENGYNMTLGGEGTIGLEPWNKNKCKIYYLHEYI